MLRKAGGYQEGWGMDLAPQLVCADAAMHRVADSPSGGFVQNRGGVSSSEWVQHLARAQGSVSKMRAGF